MKMKPPFVRNPYNYDTNEVSDETGLECKDPSLTQQQFVEESDINYIAEQYSLNGTTPQVQVLPQFGDYEGIFDFQTAQNAVVKATQDFMTLPAKMRTRFDNDPQKLLTFLSDPENRAEAEFLGLVNKTKENVNETRTESVPHQTAQPETPAPRAESNKGPDAAKQGT